MPRRSQAAATRCATWPARRGAGDLRQGDRDQCAAARRWSWRPAREMVAPPKRYRHDKALTIDPERCRGVEQPRRGAVRSRPLFRGAASCERAGAAGHHLRPATITVMRCWRSASGRCACGYARASRSRSWRRPTTAGSRFTISCN
jgi:hypothetical protein